MNEYGCEVAVMGADARVGCGAGCGGAGAVATANPTPGNVAAFGVVLAGADATVALVDAVRPRLEAAAAGAALKFVGCGTACVVGGATLRCVAAVDTACEICGATVRFVAAVDAACEIDGGTLRFVAAVGAVAADGVACEVDGAATEDGLTASELVAALAFAITGAATAVERRFGDFCVCWFVAFFAAAASATAAAALRL